MNKFRFVDLFCGGGGSITGAINALNTAGIKYDGRGFNHWDIAIDTIKANHPEVIPDYAKACAPIESVLPNEIFNIEPEKIDVVWASPSCTHHSNAAGGIPKSNQLRSQPEYLLPYLRLTKCRRMFIENVKELKNWGPILDNDIVYQGSKYKAGMPDPRKKGLFFNLWIKEIKASGYNVDMQILNSANYGAATSRERLIIQAVRKSSGDKITWPEQTHSKEPGIFSGIYKPWHSASEIIDWSIPGKSILNRSKPLSENTLKRIEAGIKKYWGNWAEPFLILLRGMKKQQTISTAIKLDKPLPMITIDGQQTGLIQPFLTRYNGGIDRNHSINNPMSVIDCSNRYGIIEPIIIDKSHSGETSENIRNNWNKVIPYLISYYGQGTCIDIKSPCPTITTKDRFGLIEGKILKMPDGHKYKLDITLRMMTMRELANATSFPKDYVFCGSDTDAKKQIGNAVPPKLAEALYKAVLAA